MLLSNSSQQQSGHYPGDGISRAVQRLEKLSTYDSELDRWNKNRHSTEGISLRERNSSSAGEKRSGNHLPSLNYQDRSKSVPSNNDGGMFSNLGRTNNKVFEKKSYAEDLRKQMEEQRRAKALARQEYIALPSTRSKANGPIAYDASPLLAAEAKFNRMNSNEELQPRPNSTVTAPAPTIREVETPRTQASTPLSQSKPPTQPYYPGFYPPPNYMYPPQFPMYPPFPVFYPPPGGNIQQPDAGTNYDPYSYYGLERKPPEVTTENRPRLENRARTPDSNSTRARARDSRVHFQTPKETETSILGIGDGRSAPERSRQRKSSVPDAVEYARELKRQMEEREQTRQKKKQEEDDYNRRIEAEAANYNPWGRGGAGAPLKDADGNPLPGRRPQNQQPPAQQHPPTYEPKVRTSISAKEIPAKDYDLINEAALPGSQSTKTGAQHYGRVNEITGATKVNDPVVLAAKNNYQAFLRQQIEEKNAQKEKEKELQRLEDEREAARIERDRVRMKEEFEREVEEKKQKEEAQRRANEELKRVAEERRKEQERRSEEVRKQAEDERRKQLLAKQSTETVQKERARSPPIPTVAKRGGSPPIPALANKPRSRSPRQSATPSDPPTSQSDIPPSRPAHQSRDPVPEVSKTQVMHQLSALREQLNRLQTVKREQNETGRAVKLLENEEDLFTPLPVTNTTRVFETALQKAARVRPQPSKPFDNLFNEDDSRMASLDEGGTDLERQCSTEFIPFSPEPTRSLDRAGPRPNNRYSRPPSVSSTTSFNIHEIAQRNAARLRRLENMHRGGVGVMDERSPTDILDDFLGMEEDARREKSLHADTILKPVL